MVTQTDALRKRTEGAENVEVWTTFWKKKATSRRVYLVQKTRQNDTDPFDGSQGKQAITESVKLHLVGVFVIGVSLYTTFFVLSIDIPCA
jgi:hypothetical protein